MEVKVIKKEDVKKEVLFKIEGKEFKDEFEQVLSRFKNSVLIKGFRRGKAPLEIVRERFFDDILEETKKSVIKKSISEYVKNDGSYIVGLPIVEDVSFKGMDYGIEFTVLFEMIPEIEVKGYKKLKLIKKKIDVKDEEIEETIKKIKEKVKEEEMDKFYKNLGVKDENELRERIRERILRDKKALSDQELEDEIYNKLLEKNKFNVPEYLILERIESIKRRFGKKEYTKEEEDKIRELAIKEIKIGIILDKIREVEKIDLSNEELNEKVKAMFGIEADKLNPVYKDSIRDSLLKQKILDFIKKESKIKEV
ncbi:MAG: hypothetical protein DRI36_00620 [Caldiserica bacterium]|nr:MAG: hypothetical protein DRI36_00620 [Caldisericota bacterium]